MPQLGETVTEGTITRWLKQVGEHVDADEPLFEVSTDKVDSEVPAPIAGVVTEILVPEGETVEVGTRLAVLGSSSSASPARDVEGLDAPLTETAGAPVAPVSAPPARDVAVSDGSLTATAAAPAPSAAETPVPAVAAAPVASAPAAPAPAERTVTPPRPAPLPPSAPGSSDEVIAFDNIRRRT